MDLLFPVKVKGVQASPRGTYLCHAQERGKSDQSELVRGLRFARQV